VTIFSAVLVLGLAGALWASPTAPRKQGPRIQATALTAARQPDVARLRNSLGAAAFADLQRDARELTASVTHVMDARARRRRKLDPAHPPRSLRRKLASVVESHAARTGERDAAAVMQDIMTMAMAGTEADVAKMAVRVQANLEAKARLREDMAALRDIIADGTFPVEFGYTHATVNEAGGDLVATAKTVTLAGAEQARALLKDLNDTLQTMTDMGQMLNLALQDAMQKQQQVMQMLSAIMKNQHDTLKAIIQNMRG
jgi:hypothetical protein